MRWHRYTNITDKPVHELQITGIRELLHLRDTSGHNHVHDKEWTYGGKEEPYIRHQLLIGGYEQEALHTARTLEKQVRTQLATQIKTNKLTRKRTTIHKTEGQEVDITRWTQGEPRIYTEKTKLLKKRYYTIGINPWQSWQNEPKSYARIAAITLAITSALRHAGYAVRVESTAFGEREVEGKGEYEEQEIWSVIRLPILREDETINPGKILRLMYTGYSRDYMAAMELYNEYGKKPTHTKWGGRCVTPEKEFYHKLGIDFVITKSWTDDIQQTITSELIPQLKEATR